MWFMAFTKSILTKKFCRKFNNLEEMLVCGTNYTKQWIKKKIIEYLWRYLCLFQNFYIRFFRNLNLICSVFKLVTVIAYKQEFLEGTTFFSEITFPLMTLLDRKQIKIKPTISSKTKQFTAPLTSEGEIAIVNQLKTSWQRGAKLPSPLQVLHLDPLI